MEDDEEKKTYFDERVSVSLCGLLYFGSQSGRLSLEFELGAGQ
jgi:hypothetical protein